MASASDTVSTNGVFSGSVSVVSLPLGVRWNPMRGALHTRASIGGTVGAGVDFHLGRHFTLGVEGGYQWMADFSDPIGARDNYSGFQFGVNIGWLFGRGTPPIE